jgi:hypothetical protein
MCSSETSAHISHIPEDSILQIKVVGCEVLTEKIMHSTLFPEVTRLRSFRKNILPPSSGFKSSFFLVHLVRRPLTGLLYQPRTIDDKCGAVGRMRIGKGNRSTRWKPAPVPLCPLQIQRDLTWARTRTATVGSRRLTAWAIARPASNGKSNHQSAGNKGQAERTSALVTNGSRPLLDFVASHLRRLNYSGRSWIPLLRNYIPLFGVATLLSATCKCIFAGFFSFFCSSVSV